MNILKIICILLLFVGIGFFVSGVWLYWVTDPISEWAGVFIVFGLLFLFSSIIFLCIDEQYDQELH